MKKSAPVGKGGPAKPVPKNYKGSSMTAVSYPIGTVVKKAKNLMPKKK